MITLDLTEFPPHSPETLERRHQALEILLSGAVAAFPTDTVWGLGTCSNDPAQVRRLFEIKGRDEFKPVSYLIPALEALEPLFEVGVPPRLLEMAPQVWPGATTLIVDAPPEILPAGRRGAPGVGFRVPAHDGLRQLLTGLPPMANTSANPSGRPPLAGAAEISASFGARLDLLLIMEPPAGGGASRVLYLRDQGEDAELRARGES